MSTASGRNIGIIGRKVVGVVLLSLPIWMALQRNLLQRAEGLGRVAHQATEREPLQEVARDSGEITDAGAFEGLFAPELPARDRELALAPQRSKAAFPPPRSLRISSAQVERLVLARYMPRGRPVGARAATPAGIELRGVSVLGLGVQDGDVLFQVNGAKVGDRSQVISQVVTALAAQQGPLVAGLSRGGRNFELVVELPRLDSLGKMHQEGLDVAPSPLR